MPNKPPPPSPLTDPKYASWYTDDTGVPPSPSPPAKNAGEHALMRLYVPAEDTLIDLGHGNTTPGIRMSTNHHAHITTADPRTTISLGAAGGDGIGDPAAGVQIYTAGEKRETIDGTTEEWYKASKTEHVYVGLVEDYACPKDEKVQGPWTEACSESKEERIQGTWSQTCDSAKTETVAGKHHLTVGKAAIHRFGASLTCQVTGSKSETIRGDLTVDIAGDWNVNVTGHRKFHSKGDWYQFAKGLRFNQTDGASISRNLGIVATTNDVKIERSTAKMDYVGLRHQAIAIELQVGDVEIKAEKLIIFK
jgi:hypothetical protein